MEQDGAGWGTEGARGSTVGTLRVQRGAARGHL